MNAFAGEGEATSKNAAFCYFKKHFVSFTVNGQTLFGRHGKSAGW